jgi:hypothetical protein
MSSKKPQNRPNNYVAAFVVFMFIAVFVIGIFFVGYEIFLCLQSNCLLAFGGY